MRVLRFLFAGIVLSVLQGVPSLVQGDGQSVLDAHYADRAVLPDPTGASCPDPPQSLTPINR